MFCIDICVLIDLADIWLYLCLYNILLKYMCFLFVLKYYGNYRLFFD